MSANFVQKISVKIEGRVVELAIDEARQMRDDISRAINGADSGSYQVKLAVSDAFNVRIDQLLSDRRHKRVAFARQVAMWLHRVLFNLSFQEIADLFPKQNGHARDHGTIIHAYNLIETRMFTDKELSAKILSLRDALGKESAL